MALNSLSFQDRVETILKRSHDIDGGFDEAARKNEPGEYVHRDFETPYRFRYRPDGRNRPHRPEVDDDLPEALAERLREENPRIPVEVLSFDDTLGAFLDVAEEYYETVDCYVDALNL